MAGQKLLSCVYRTGQRFGAGHVVDVLRGADTARVRQHRHDRQSTFGIGADLSVVQWRSVVRQLMVQGYLLADPERYGALRLTGSSRALLRGEVALPLREEVRRAPPSRAPVPAAGGDGEPMGEADQALWEALRAARRTLADDQGVPPFVIFHDSTLWGMVALRPRSAEQMLRVSGVGAAKLERYGAHFLEVIRGHDAGPAA